jgi:ankyrin repeat protein
VQVLLRAGANPSKHETDNGSALHWAARNSHLDVTRLLLESGAILEHRDSKGHTAYDWATDREHWDVAALLEQRGPQYSSSKINSQLWHGTVSPTSSRPGQLWDWRP